MKITICSSIDFTPDILRIKKYLETIGHEVNIPYLSQKIEEGEITFEEFMDKKMKNQGDLIFRNTASEDVIKRYYGKIKNSDAILILNMEKKGIANYIGGSTLMEMSFAYVLEKKIFLYNPVPEYSERMHYVDELLFMKPTVINANLDSIR